MHAKASQTFEKDIDKSFAYLISLFIFVDSETLKLDHFDEAGYTFIAPRLVNFPVVNIISAINRNMIRLSILKK